MSKDIYQEVTDRIVTALDEGTVPWAKPWSVKVGAPRSLDGRPYRGVNVLLLGLQNYADPRWATYKNIEAKGGQVKKGEKGTFVVFFKMLTDKTDPEKKIPLLRYFYVFNVLQTEGLALEPIEEVPVLENGDAVLAGYKDAPEVRHDCTAACYIPSEDIVRLPAIGSFTSLEAYYQTQYHELVHSTGHKDRLNRPDLISQAGFGSAPYSREELTAEIGAAILSTVAGIEPNIEASASYLESWLVALKNDKRLIVSAASRATKAVDYIRGES